MVSQNKDFGTLTLAAAMFALDLSSLVSPSGRAFLGRKRTHTPTVYLDAGGVAASEIRASGVVEAASVVEVASEGASEGASEVASSLPIVRAAKRASAAFSSYAAR